jgi:ATP/maltotriose-dependent transcriptional regulator MalT
MRAEDEGLIHALRDRLDASERKQGRLHARLQDAREHIARLKEDLEDCLSEARERMVRLTKEKPLLRGEPGKPEPGLPA